MEMLLYQSTQFRDVKKILDRAHGFAGLLTAGGIEASRLDVPFVCDQKVLSRYDDACADIRRILTMQLGLELPKGFSIPLEAEDLAVFFFAAVRPAADAGLPGAKSESAHRRTFRPGCAIARGTLTL